MALLKYMSMGGQVGVPEILRFALDDKTGGNVIKIRFALDDNWWHVKAK